VQGSYRIQASGLNKAVYLEVFVVQIHNANRPSAKRELVDWISSLQVGPHKQVAAIPCQHWPNNPRLLHAGQPSKQNEQHSFEWLRLI
jgi:hypothetical protein